MNIINKSIDDFIDRKTSKITLLGKELNCTFSAIPAKDKFDNDIFEVDREIVKAYYPEFKTFAKQVFGIEKDNGFTDTEGVFHPGTGEDIIPYDSMYLADERLYTRDYMIKNIMKQRAE